MVYIKYVCYCFNVNSYTLTNHVEMCIWFNEFKTYVIQKEGICFKIFPLKVPIETSWSNTVRYPITGVGNPMIYARLSLLRTTISSRYKSYQSPSSFMFHHQRSTTVPLAGIFSSVVISSAYHFVIDDNVNTLVSVPLLALSVVYHWNIDYLEHNSIVCIHWIVDDTTLLVMFLVSVCFQVLKPPSRLPNHSDPSDACLWEVNILVRYVVHNPPAC